MTTRTTITSVAAAAAMIVGATLGGCGTTSDSSGSHSVAQDHNQVDVAFAQNMIPHHAQALAMSRLAAPRAVSPQVKDLAARILVGQQPEIDQMSGCLGACPAPVTATTNPT